MRSFFCKYLLASSFLCAAAAAARADGHPVRIEWPGWRLESSEHLNTDWGDNNVAGNRRVPFPMASLVDGDPDTTWAWHDSSPTVLRFLNKPNQRSLKRFVESEPRSFTLNSKMPVRADEMRLMSGYNRRPDLFRRNDRVVEIRIWLDGKPIKRVALADRMGWHSVSLPKRPFRALKVEMLGIRKGTGKDNDICLSELALFHRGRQMPFQLPRVVKYTRSSMGAWACYLLRHDGRVLGHSYSDTANFTRDASGRFVVAVQNQAEPFEASDLLWVADTQRGQMIYRRSVLDEGLAKGYSLRWINSRTLEMQVGVWNRPEGVRRKIIHLPPR